MKTILISMGIIFLSMTGMCQGINKIPFASTNRIELSVENGSSSTVKGVKVEVQNLPLWIHLVPTGQTISMMKPKEEQQVSFSFSVDKTAPVNKEQTLTFIISTPAGEQWTKQIKISIAAPERFELFQNYPNPFNPTTRIEYQLPKESWVVLKVYDVLGQEVSTLFEGKQDAGFNSVEWYASNIANGVYFYRIQADHFSAIKKMMLVK